MKLERLINLADFESAARKRLPRPVFDVIAGGAGDETTLDWNSSAFSRIRLHPRSLVDIREIDLATTILGTKTSMPILLDPAGYQRMAHRDAELAVARAAGAAGTVFALSTVSSYQLEDVSRVASGPKWFQLYLPPGDRGPEKILGRAAAAGFDALCLTVDTPTKALRERDTRNKFSVPLSVTPHLVAQTAMRPRWAVDFVRGGVGRGTFGFNKKVLSMNDAGNALSSALRPVTPEEIRLVRRLWDGPLVIKGVLRADQCETFLNLGADALVVSNHGGRQLDTAVSTVEALPRIVDIVRGRAEVYLDGGIRRGTDVVKAVALGARAVLIGRPYLYGLAVGGEAGVRRVLEILYDETENAMGLLGARRLCDLDRSFVTLPHEGWTDTPCSH
ncbi:L-lactate dehydrogenase [Rhodococcus wratislaviensis]|uniref:L-lactate dehydrogenase n=1 Tax=Rhodococcus wratislaviensis TaxID=44752 RepID=A0A402CKZ8_RHOWR|nr:alpha-hydroxy acid oxidase [Rhodococcus wratislaviensis]GCE44291.1 L-lactate dehydrogenase [Rhodococcus wratislaviensis]